MPRVLVIQHEDDCPPAWVGDWLTAVGVELELVRPYRGDQVPERLAVDGHSDPDGHLADGLIVLGGSMGADDDATVPWLAPTKQLLARCVEAGLPTWGICLGHQLLATTLGGRVERHPGGRQVGVFDVGLIGSGATRDPLFDDPLLGGLPPGARAVQWNQDVVTEIPAGAELLATTPGDVPQMIRYGPRAWGVQFHPEVGVEIVRRWTKADDTPAEAAEPALAEIESIEPELAWIWRPVVERFAALL